jgi:hypothetical protein
MTVINRGTKLVASPGFMITHFAIQGQSVCILYEIPNLFLFVYSIMTSALTCAMHLRLLVKLGRLHRSFAAGLSQAAELLIKLCRTRP